MTGKYVQYGGGEGGGGISKVERAVRVIVGSIVSTGMSRGE